MEAVCTWKGFCSLAAKGSVLISSGSVCSRGRRRALSYMNIPPNTYVRAVHGLPLLQTEAGEEFLN